MSLALKAQLGKIRQICDVSATATDKHNQEELLWIF